MNKDSMHYNCYEINIHTISYLPFRLVGLAICDADGKHLLGGLPRSCLPYWCHTHGHGLERSGEWMV